MGELSDRIGQYRGSAREVGIARGRALGSRLEQNIRWYIERRPASPQALDLDKLQEGALPWLRSLPRRFQDELEGMAEGAGISLQQVAEWNYVEECVQDGCSGFICLLDGHAWVGRNNDSFVPEVWGYASIREVDGRIPTLSFSMEGDVFAPTGLNRERLWLHYNYLPVWDTPRNDRYHWPGYVWIIEALETCSNLAQVEALLHTIDRDGGMMLFAIDGKTDEFAIYECACCDHVKRIPQEGWLAGTNHYCAWKTPMEMGESESERRYACVEEHVRELYNRHNPISFPNDLIRILADPRVERGGEYFATVYANVACPSTGEIWHTYGGFPAASQGNWQMVRWPG